MGVHKVNADITVFQLLERLMRYRQKLTFMRCLFGCGEKNHVTVNKSNDGICQDTIIDAYTVLGVYKGKRSEWSGYTHFLKALASFQLHRLPYEWFHHTTDFMERFMVNK